MKVKGKKPAAIPAVAKPSTGDVQEELIKEILRSNSNVGIPEGDKGPIEAVLIEASKPAENVGNSTLNEKRTEGEKRERTGQKDMERNKRLISPIETSSASSVSEKVGTPQESVLQATHLDHTRDLDDGNPFNELEGLNDLKEKTTSVSNLSSSIKVEEQFVQLKPPSLAIKEEEVRQFFAAYTERYSQRNINGFLSLFSARAAQNGKEGFDKIEKAYSDLFAQSEEFRFALEEMQIRIYPEALISYVYYKNVAVVEARYEVDRTLKKSGKKKVLRGNIGWILVRENGDLKIRFLNYKHQK
jgi:hypothetical protein